MKVVGQFVLVFIAGLLVGMWLAAWALDGAGPHY